MTDVYSDKERMAVLELKKRMEGDMENEMYEDDSLFYRFLIARDFDVRNAEYMLRKHLEWRKMIDIKNISKYKPFEVCEKYFIVTNLGYDKEGCIVGFTYFGSIDFKGIAQSCSVGEILKFMVQMFEKDTLDLKKQSEKLGRTVDKIVYIADVENFSLTQATDTKVLSISLAFVHMYLDNYPERLKALYFINAPIYFHMFFAVLKPFIPSKVMSKIKIHSDDSWKKKILEEIDADVLPVFLGGTRTDPDGNPFCQTIIKKTQPVPKCFYIRQMKRQFSNSPDVQKINVPKSSVHEVSMDVTQPGTHLEWEFQLKSGDIKFGILHKDNKGNKTEIVPLQRLNTDECTESGLYKCERTGTYIVVFDNSYSFFRSKEIYFKIRKSSSVEESSADENNV